MKSPATPEKSRIGIRKCVHRSEFGTKIIRDTRTGTRKDQEEPKPNVTHHIREVATIAGFQDTNILSQLWGYDTDNYKDDISEIGMEANVYIKQIMGEDFYNGKTREAPREKDVKDIHDIRELQQICNSTLPNTPERLLRIKQAFTKLRMMHILEAVKRGYDEERIAAASEQLYRRFEHIAEEEGLVHDDVPLLELGSFDPEAIDIDFKSCVHETPKNWSRCIQLNILTEEYLEKVEEEDGSKRTIKKRRVADKQPVLHISPGKSSSSVVHKCLNKAIEQVDLGVLDATRLRIEFPPNTISEMTQAERDRVMHVVAYILQNMGGTNLIAGEGKDTFRTGGGINKYSTKNSQRRINFKVSYRPNISESTLRIISNQLEALIRTDNELKKLLGISKKKRTITISTERIPAVINRLDKKIATLKKTHANAETPSGQKTSLTAQIKKLEKVKYLVRQLGSGLKSQTVITLSPKLLRRHGKRPIVNGPMGVSIKHQNSKKDGKKRMQPVALEIQILEHSPLSLTAADHADYIEGKNAAIREKLGIKDKDPNDAFKRHIMQLAVAIMSENDDIKEEIILGVRKDRQLVSTISRTMREHCIHLLRSLLTEDNLEIIEKALAEEKSAEAKLCMMAEEIPCPKMAAELEAQRTAIRDAIPLVLTISESPRTGIRKLPAELKEAIETLLIKYDEENC